MAETAQMAKAGSGTRNLGGKVPDFQARGRGVRPGDPEGPEIIGLMDITAVPRTPDFVKGVINLRGKVIPVVDLRLKFGMADRRSTPRKRASSWCTSARWKWE